MSTLSVARRAGTALVASALAASLVASGDPAHAVSSSSPAGHGATWLSHQLNSKGLIHNRQFKFDDYGLTADTALALRAIGGHKKDVRHARHALARHAVDYTTFGTDRYAGATAKLTVVAQQTGGDARHFGGINLVKRLAQRVATGAPIAGRIEDRSTSGDFANTIGQVFAVRGLLKAGDPAGRSALKFLLRQQCGNGYFRLNFNTDKTARDQGCGKGDPADTDVTALAVVELAPVAKGHGRLKKDLAKATRWLKRHQKDNGSFGGGPSTSAANANSTGLAGWAFQAEGKCGAARDAARWVARLQVTGNVSGTPLAGERGAIAYDRATMKLAKRDGIDKTTRDQWRRAGAQAAPALLALSRCRS
ncbi:hypothetical protein [Nocardioides sp.]|jgi:hypothetical protein|uniref:hypothetical protein n=1 Tax=Nocardioides sp. TaxID=35761 RepID=UPI002F4150F6